MNYESMVYVYGWMMEEHQLIGINYQLIWHNYIEDSMTQHYMKFNEDQWDESRFWDHTFSWAEFDKSNKKYKATADKKRHEELFEEEEIENRPWPFMRFYRSNEIAKPYQQPPVEE